MAAAAAGPAGHSEGRGPEGQAEPVAAAGEREGVGAAHAPPRRRPQNSRILTECEYRVITRTVTDPRARGCRHPPQPTDVGSLLICLKKGYKLTSNVFCLATQIEQGANL